MTATVRSRDLARRDGRKSGRPATEAGAIRRAIAYVFLVGYALLMIVPFAWQVITSFKTDRDALQLTIIPDPFTLQGWENGFLTLEPPIPQLFLNSDHRRDAGDDQQPGPGEHRLAMRSPGCAFRAASSCSSRSSGR